MLFKISFQLAKILSGIFILVPCSFSELEKVNVEFYVESTPKIVTPIKRGVSGKAEMYKTEKENPTSDKEEYKIFCNEFEVGDQVWVQHNDILVVAGVLGKIPDERKDLVAIVSKGVYERIAPTEKGPIDVKIKKYIVEYIK